MGIKVRSANCPIGQKVEGSKPGIHVHEGTLVHYGACMYMNLVPRGACRHMKVPEGAPCMYKHTFTRVQVCAVMYMKGQPPF